MATETMKGFNPVTPEARGVQVDREALATGVIVQHVGTRYVDSDKARGFRHTFRTRGGLVGGMVFEIWGTAELNGMLKKLRPGVIMFLRYGGKVRHPDLPGADVHKWDVRDSRHSEVTPELREAIKDNGDAQFALEAVISDVREKERARFEQRRADAQARGEEPPPHTDDDLPF